MMMKTCKKCGEEKSRREFRSRNSQCISCGNEQTKKWKMENRERYLAQKREYFYKTPPEVRFKHYLSKTYKISVEDYKKLLLSQKGKCKICSVTSGGKEKFRLCIDHCHKTGVVRGLLCDRCNTALGFVKDDISILKGMIKYLKKYV